MNTKKIWILAVIFGFAMSVTFFILTSSKGNTNSVNETAKSEDQVKETEEVLDTPADLLKISAGKRAISIAVEEDQSVSNFIRPGSFVDVVIVQPNTDQEGFTSNILLENVRVLAVGNTVNVTEDENLDPYHLVTLEVSPSDGASLAREKTRGTVTLMLRGINENAPANNELPQK